MDYPENVKNYLQIHEQWMNHFGFSPLGVESNWLFDKAYKRDRAEASKFGKVNAFCFLKYENETYNSSKFQQFSSESFKYALTIRKGNPLGFGGTLVVYPCLIVEKATQEQINFLNGYVNKHYAACEFPSLLELSTGEVYFYSKTPMWGALYYKGYRKESLDFFSPKVWQVKAGGN